MADPPPRNSVAFYSFVLFGCATLFPYNALITCTDWWAELFAKGFIFDLTSVLVVSNLCTTSFLAFIEPSLPSRAKAMVNSLPDRVSVSFICLLVVSLAVPFLRSSVFVLVASAATGCANAVAQSQLQTWASCCHSSIISAVATGLGVSGVLVCVLRIASKAAFPGDPSMSMKLFFFTSGFSELASVILLWRFKSDPYFLRYCAKAGDDANVDDFDDTQGLLLMEGEEAMMPGTAAGSGGSPPSYSPSSSRRGNADTFGSADILGAVWKEAASIFLIFFVTLSIFPGLLAQLESTSIGLVNGWWPLALITIFNVFDLAGKWAPGASWAAALFPSSSVQLMLSVSRVVFVPALLLVALGQEGGTGSGGAPTPSSSSTSSSSSPLPPGALRTLGRFLSNDFVIMVVVAGLALSNGFLGTVGLVTGPDSAADVLGPGARARAAPLLVFFLLLGLSAGSFAGIGIKSVLDAAQRGAAGGGGNETSFAL